MLVNQPVKYYVEILVKSLHLEVEYMSAYEKFAHCVPPVRARYHRQK